MDEYISREAVVRYLKGYSESELHSRSPYGMITSSVLNKAERALSEMPAADVQPVKHAHWYINPDGYYPQCSNCGYEPPRELIRRNGDALIFPRYCPECGADTVEAMRVALDALEDKMNGAEVIFKKGRKKYRSKNFVIYDIDFLLENLAREIFMLYQAKSDFDKPLLDFDKIRRMFVDYEPCEGCTNPDAYGTICVKCGACGRKFDDKGCLIDD